MAGGGRGERLGWRRGGREGGRALLAAAPADDARWLAAGSGEPRHAEAFAAAHGAIAAYLEHVGHASAGEARARADDADAGGQ